MDNQTTENLLPKIIERKLELGLKGATISFKEIDISSDKAISDTSDVIAQKLCSFSSDRALQLWNAFDTESQYALAYPDTGTFNLDLIQKLDIPGDILSKAFLAKHTTDLFALESAPLPSDLYAQAFHTIQSELLATCKQLASKHGGHERLAKFLGGFDCEVLATIVRHELAGYFIGERGTHLSIDVDDEEEEDTAVEDKVKMLQEDEFDLIGEDEFDLLGKNEFDIMGEEKDIITEEEEELIVDEEFEMMCEKRNYLRPDWSLEETEKGFRTVEHEELEYDNPELFEEPDTLQELVQAFKNGDTLPATLELTNWLHHNAPEIFSDVRNILVFHSEERGLPIWYRPNPTEEIRKENPGLAEKETPQTLYVPEAPRRKAAEDDATNEQSLTIANDEKEWLRLIRLYTITHPDRKNLKVIDEKQLYSQGMVVASILVDSGKDTKKLQTFEHLRNAVWNAVGFSVFKKWVEQLPNSARLVESSGKKRLLQEMNFLGRVAFEEDLTILHNSIERSKYAVSKLYGWFSLVKIFWNIVDKRPQFTRLASVKDDTVVWEENITCCTLIIQATLGTEKLSFSLEDLIHFREACQKPNWSKIMKESFRVLAEENHALSAVPVFHDYIDFLSVKSTNIFRITEDIKISSEADRERIRKIRKMARDHVALMTVHGENPEFVKLLFRAGVSKNKAIAGYLEEACGYLDHLFSEREKTGTGDYVLPK